MVMCNVITFKIYKRIWGQTETFQEMAAQKFPRDIVVIRERMRPINHGFDFIMLIQKHLRRLGT